MFFLTSSLCCWLVSGDQVCRHPFSQFLEANVSKAEGCRWHGAQHTSQRGCVLGVLLSGCHIWRRAQTRTGSRCRCEWLGPGSVSFPLPCCRIGQTQGLVIRKSPIMGVEVVEDGNSSGFSSNHSSSHHNFPLKVFFLLFSTYDRLVLEGL